MRQGRVPGNGRMAFPNIPSFPESYPGPYERQMGKIIAALLSLFAGRVPDSESIGCVLELAAAPARWSAVHAVFDEVRRRLLRAMDARDQQREWQHHFEESCCQALYNATDPQDPFDPASAFFVAGSALGLAWSVGVSVEAVVAVLAPVTRLTERPEAESSPEAARVDVRCEECGKETKFPAAERGSVQNCPHCGAYVDVGEDTAGDGAFGHEESEPPVE